MRSITRLMIITFCLCCLGMAAVAQEAQGRGEEEEEREEQQAASESQEPELSLEGSDPVELIRGEVVAGKEEITAAHKGYLYRFVSEENRKLFESDPERWGIQGDGSCIVIPEARANPNIYTVYEGKIYIFARLNCLVRFTGDPERFVK